MIIGWPAPEVPCSMSLASEAFSCAAATANPSFPSSSKVPASILGFLR